ncbi:MAG TPA: VOC family protein [Microlunatus sp.]|nr:VOC family protein [Microlunatus sp.]
MKLELFYVPTSDLSASLTLYRDAFGASELWREGETTAALTFPGTDAQVMLDASDPTAPPGPMFTVESVAAFHAALPAGLTVVGPPAEIPGGMLAVYADGGGTIIYVLDQAADAAAG